ncbi:hypothetical protein KSC_070150 [Ktedonobacter sp. SOSP1-52]|nr:hypothetical protein KSC_070150 [Ktedonobacter sp. SOSP1-52]
MSTGYAILMGIDGNKVNIKPIPKFEKMKRVSAQPAWIMRQQPMPSISSSTRQSLEIYSRLSLADAQPSYNQAMERFPIQ